MTPVIFLSDGYLANGAEPGDPESTELPRSTCDASPDARHGRRPRFLPYQRDERLVRPWAIPGTPGLEHRIGGLEKEDITGNVSYDPANHEAMVSTRPTKIAGIANDIPLLKWRARRGRAARRRLGRHATARSARRCSAARRKGQAGRRTRICVISIRCRATPATS